MRRIQALALTIGVLLTAAVAAQDKLIKDKDKKSAEPEPIVISKQLPRGWKTLGLTEKQKKEVYRVRAAFAAKLQKLEEAKKALRLKESADLEAILTEAQRSRLKELRGGTDKK
jgi:hypothetical protein